MDIWQTMRMSIPSPDFDYNTDHHHLSRLELLGVREPDIAVGVQKLTLFFFYKNKVYKNVEPQIPYNLKNILDAQITIFLYLFLR